MKVVDSIQESGRSYNWAIFPNYQRRSQVGTGRVADHRDSIRVATELRGRAGKPAQCVGAVLEAGGEPVLGRESVVHRNGEKPRCGKFAGKSSMREMVSRDPRTAMD